jgi:cytochrome P450
VASLNQYVDSDASQSTPRGFLADMHDTVHKSLAPQSDSLAALTLSATRELAAELAASAQAFDASTGAAEFDLLVWIRHMVTSATARAFYGPCNPLATDSSLADAFWSFDHGLGTLLLGLLPRITARKAYMGRERLVAALTEYLARGDDVEAAAVVRARIAVARQGYGWADGATARSELSFLFAGIVNTAATAFWTVLHLAARPEWLAEVRDELAREKAVVVERKKVATRGGKEGQDQTEEEVEFQELHLSIFRNGSSCPRLRAVFRECLRLGSDHASARLVKTDTIITSDNRSWFLRAGSVVQIAGGVMHADPSLWGPNAHDFDPDRFLDATSRGKRPRDVHPQAFRAFGGGATVCPGRHFATTEVLAFVAMLVLTFDLEAADGSANIRVPQKEDGVLPVHILEPKTPVRVMVRLRDERKIEVM